MEDLQGPLLRFDSAQPLLGLFLLLLCLLFAGALGLGLLRGQLPAVVWAGVILLALGAVLGVALCFCREGVEIDRDAAQVRWVRSCPGYRRVVHRFAFRDCEAVRVEEGHLRVPGQNQWRVLVIQRRGKLHFPVESFFDRDKALALGRQLADLTGLSLERP